MGAVDLSPGGGLDGEVDTLSHMATVYDALGDCGKARDLREQLLGVGLVYDALGDRRQALDFFEQALPLQRQFGDRGGEATTLNNIGLVYDALDDTHKALDFYEQAVELVRQIGDRWPESMGHANIARVYEKLGSLEKPRISSRSSSSWIRPSNILTLPRSGCIGADSSKA